MMPRRRVSEMADEAFRLDGPPAPPRGLDARCRRLWREIVGSKPAGFFDPVGQILLRQLVVATVALERVERQLIERPEDPLLTGVASRLGPLVRHTAAALRLSPASIHR